ncbi:LysM-like peptidoglycan-binding domain-containing protein, partial [Methylophaga sp. UBA5088]
MKKVHRKGSLSAPAYIALFVILVAMIILTVLRLDSDMTNTSNITISKPVVLPALSSTSDTNDTSVELTEPNKAMATDDPAQLILVSTPEPQTHTVDYKVKSGDSLESIFKHFSLPIQTLFGILEADEPYLEMDVLHPGQQLGFTFNNDDTLMALSVVSSTKKTIVYQKEDDNHFSHNETIAPTTWETVVLKGEISNSFYLAAANAGISDPTIMMLTKLIRNKINFRRDLRKNDQFQVIIKRE